MLLVTAALFIGFAAAVPGFATLGNLLGMVRSVAILGILSLAMAVVVIARGLDLSLVASMAVSSALMLQLMQNGWSTPTAIAAALAFCVLIGIINGFIIAFVEVPALFTTLATSFLIAGLGRTFLLDGLVIYLPASSHGLTWLGQGTVLGIPTPILCFAGVAVIVQFWLRRTSMGRFIYAHGDNAEAARLTGISLRPLTMMEYAAASIIGFVAGMIMAASAASMDLRVINSSLIFDVILVVVLGGVSLVGGRGSVFSVIAGTALIGTLLNGMTIMDLNSNAQNIAKGIVLLAAIVLDNRLHPRDEETARQGD